MNWDGIPTFNIHPLELVHDEVCRKTYEPSIEKLQDNDQYTGYFAVCMLIYKIQGGGT